MEKVKLPETWGDKKKEEWIKRKRSGQIKKIPVVTNKIIITNTEILPLQQSSQSVDSVAVTAEAALFLRVDFERSTFSGKAIFDNATFNGEAFFGDATFNGEASFTRATFSKEEAVFSRASFGGEAFFSDATFGKAFGDRLYETFISRTGIRYKMTDYFYANFEIDIDYDSAPPDDVETTDVTWVVGIGTDF